MICLYALLITCAVALASPGSDRIFNGQEVDISKIPFQLGLEFRGYGLTCGAIILDKKRALTAAQCVKGFRKTDLTLRSGSSKHEKGGKTHGIDNIIVHENYVESIRDNDIAILIIKDEFTEAPAVLATSRLQDGQECMVSGWGATEDDSYSETLLAAKVNIVNDNVCKSMYEAELPLTDSMMCATAADSDACEGDYGGPLVCGNVVYGISSWALDCADNNHPGVYTNVAKFISWIDNVKA